MSYDDRGLDCKNTDCRVCGRACAQGSRYDYVLQCFIKKYNCPFAGHDREYREYDDGREEVIHNY